MKKISRPRGFTLTEVILVAFVGTMLLALGVVAITAVAYCVSYLFS